ncbi:MAG TPA: hypothetical protein VIK72_07215 [Clostridiaceae bacterium]
MSIEINSSNNTSYNTNYSISTKDVGQNFNEVLSSSLDEEDQLLYERLKKAGVDLTNYTLEWQKQHIKTLGFPPLSAPSSVKAWREMEEKMLSKEREQFQRNIISLMGTMKYNNKGLEEECKKPNFSYTAYVQEMLKLVDNIKGMEGFNYSLTNTSLGKFLDSLKGY